MVVVFSVKPVIAIGSSRFSVQTIVICRALPFCSPSDLSSFSSRCSRSGVRFPSEAESLFVFRFWTASFARDFGLGRRLWSLQPGIRSRGVVRSIPGAMSGFASGLPYFGKMGLRETEDYATGLRLGMAIGPTTTSRETGGGEGCCPANNPPVQLDLLPLRQSSPRVSSPGPAVAIPWQPLVKTTSWTESANGETRSSGGGHGIPPRGIDVNQIPSATDYDDDAVVSSPNSTVSSFQIDSAMNLGSHASSGKRERDNNDPERTCSRASDEEEGDGTRKKLRLSKEQSALLEESFKEHNTLNPKQKLALAKQLSLRPRQVEVWFQNRRARTKLKQTEVDCEFLKRCCETLTEENRRLQKEVQELRALKVSAPFYMQMPAATLSMCPSCERVASSDNHRTLSPWLALTSNASRTFQPPVRS